MNFSMCMLFIYGIVDTMNDVNIKSKTSDLKRAAFPEQNADGIDLSLIRDNLRLTPSERLRRGDRARKSAMKLLQYGRIKRQKRV